MVLPLLHVLHVFQNKHFGLYSAKWDWRISCLILFPRIHILYIGLEEQSIWYMWIPICDRSGFVWGPNNFNFRTLWRQRKEYSAETAKLCSRWISFVGLTPELGLCLRPQPIVSGPRWYSRGAWFVSSTTCIYPWSSLSLRDRVTYC